MTKQEFIEYVAPRIVIDSLERDLLPSPRISQCIFESTYGTSTLAVKANALFGVKDNDQWNGKVYNKLTGEYYNGVYNQVTANFRAYNSWDESITDQGDYLENRWISKYHPEMKRFAKLKGVRDYKEFANLLKECGYATSLTYPETVCKYIELHDLTKYDSMSKEEAEKLIRKENNKNEENNEGNKEENIMRINVHAGHNPDGKTACGAIGFIKESTEARLVKDEVIAQLRELGHTVYDCTCENGTSQSDVLKKIVAKCNAHTVDLDVSIHFNAGAGDSRGNDRTTGTEVYVYSSSSKSKSYATNVCKAIGDLGFRNRGVKYSTSLYVLKHTKAPAMLVECCFVDDKDDVELYNYKAMASAIVYGITGQRVEEKEEENEKLPDGSETTTGDKKKLYRVQVGAYSVKANAENMAKKLKDSGFDAIVVQA